ncbi:hypothetical protein A0J48_017130, partial [Sphaerospermopsis aphanizomenoides BCCUSP55]|nr:hypothetical protein [Sphaerospermopsis aphanizomenoides BCCUSP55]
LIGLWLVWQTIKISYEIDILKVSVNWFSARPIILPSVLFLISPFSFSYIFHVLLNLPADLHKLFKNPIIAQSLITFGAVISLYIGNRALERFRKTQEQKKIAKILIAAMEAHIEDFEKLNINIKGWISKLQRESLERMFNNIKKDDIYESGLKSVGLFDIKYIDIISKYSRKLNHITDEILNIYELDQDQNTYIVTSGNLGRLKEQINMLTISALLNSMILSREILQDEDKFKEYKIHVKREYTSQIRKWKSKQELWKTEPGISNETPIPQELEILLKEYSQFPEIEHYFKLNLEYFSNSSAQNLNE